MQYVYIAYSLHTRIFTQSILSMAHLLWNDQ